MSSAAYHWITAQYRAGSSTLCPIVAGSEKRSPEGATKCLKYTITARIGAIATKKGIRECAPFGVEPARRRSLRILQSSATTIAQRNSSPSFFVQAANPAERPPSARNPAECESAFALSSWRHNKATVARKKKDNGTSAYCHVSKSTKDRKS